MYVFERAGHGGGKGLRYEGPKSRKREKVRLGRFSLLRLKGGKNNQCRFREAKIGVFRVLRRTVTHRA